MTYANWITVLVILSMTGQMINFWCTSHKQPKLKASYALTIIVGILFGTIETLVALHDPAQRALLAYNILYAWMVWCGIRGLRNLRQVDR